MPLAIPASSNGSPPPTPLEQSPTKPVHYVEQSSSNQAYQPLKPQVTDTISPRCGNDFLWIDMPAPSIRLLSNIWQHQGSDASAKRVRWSYRIATRAYEPVTKGLSNISPLYLIEEVLAILSRQMGQLYLRYGKAMRMPGGTELMTVMGRRFSL